MSTAKLLKWPWLCGLLMLVLMCPAWAVDSLYENDGVVDVTVPPDLFQTPDATNFVNLNWFQINFGLVKGGGNVDTFESEDTVNYTNNGTIVATSTLVTNNGPVIIAESPGCGFNFDTYNTQSGLEYMAGNFYNAGSIRANSSVDLGNDFILVSTIGTCSVDASNILNPGTIDLGEDGLMRLTGQNIDLTRGNLTLENGINGLTANLYGAGGFGLDTNDEWNPGTDLGANFAISSLPFQIVLTDSTPYFNFVSSNNGTNVIIRSAFVEDFSTPPVPFNVYFDSTANFGGGSVTVEWLAGYTNYATGATITNYLYLNDNYVLGASTNVFLEGTPPPGYPDNFTFTESTTKLTPGNMATPEFFNVFNNVTISNFYAYVDATLIPTTFPTNANPYNPSGALTNLPGRLQINAGNDLNLSYVTINQPNYMSLASTNQFDGSTGSSISSPFADINLGVTNGFLTISNLLAPSVPQWSGTVDAWSTEFFQTNAIGGTNDDRVLIVSSQLAPVSQSYVQNLTLHGTNLVLSDALNILTKLSIDARNLTLTTNPFAAGATSPAGELVWENPSILFSNSLPNLINLTNNGIIQCANLISLGQALPLGAIINNGSISDGGSAFWVTNFLSSGTIANGTGSFQVQASTVTLTNGAITATNYISIAATTIEASNVVLDAGSALTFTADVLSDGFPNGTTGLTNGNNWSVGNNALSGFRGIYLQNGLNLTLTPVIGSGLLGTTITSLAATNKLINNLWAARDYGDSNAGYTNNAAIGQLILNAQTPGPATQFYFSGTGTSNAIYVDHLVLDGYTSYLYHNSSNNIPSLGFNTNIVIYYADATASGVGDVSFLLNGFNHDTNYPAGHLRWVPTYTGYFSSTNIVYSGNVTNTMNAGVVSTYSELTGNPPPELTASQINFKNYLTNNPANTIAISWNTVPLLNNYLYYSTNLVNWQLLTNMYLMTNPFSLTIPGPITRVTVSDPLTSPGRYYQVIVSP